MASNGSYQQMDVDEKDNGSNWISALESYGIYNDDSFPLDVRVELDPLIKEFQLDEYALDLNSQQNDVIHRVNSICDDFMLRLKQRSHDSASPSEYLMGSKVNAFVRECLAIDSREFFVRLNSHLDLERRLSQSNDNLDDFCQDFNQKYEDLNRKLMSLIRSRKEQIETIAHLDNFKRNLFHNYRKREVISQDPENSELSQKVDLQKMQYLTQLSKFKDGLARDLETQQLSINSLPQLVFDFTDISGKTLVQKKIRHPGLLNQFLHSLKRKFSLIYSNLSKLERIICNYIEKLNTDFLALGESIPIEKLENLDHNVCGPLDKAQRILIKNSLVISKEPSFSSRCLKKSKKLTCYELLLLLQGATVTDAHLEAGLVTERGLRRIREDLLSHRKPQLTDDDLGGHFKGKEASLDQDVQMDITKFVFKDLMITSADRKHKQNQAVTEQKHSIIFYGSVTVDNKTVDICTSSIPIVVSVHANQTSKSLASIFWDDNFSLSNRTGLEVRPYVSWRDMAVALRNLFRLELEREPTDLNMEYLKDRLYGCVPQDRDITFEMFSKGTKEIPLSFWEWLWGSIQLIGGDNKLLQLWKDGYIVGYITQSNARSVIRNLHQSNPQIPISSPDAERLFLIRFSESKKELITIQGHLHDTTKGWGIFSIKSYNAKDLEAIPLSTRILDRFDCQTLLYKCSETNDWRKKRKEEIFIREVPDDDQSSLPYGYISWTLKERTDDSHTDLSNFRLEANEANDGDNTLSPFSNEDNLLEEPLSVERPYDESFQMWIEQVRLSSTPEDPLFEDALLQASEQS